jgi:microcin C transport system ATP-binding protein
MEEETLGVVGESGSGKTSLALAILKLINSEGSITFQNQNLQNFRNINLLKFRKNAQIIFQDPYGSLSPKMNIEAIVGEGLDVHEKISKSKRTEMILEILNEVGLDGDMITRYPHEFSGGQRQRIAIARALILKPKLLILDEPTSALDVSVQLQVINLLKKIQKKYSLSYIFISHDIALIKAVSDKIIIMKDGIIVETGETKSLFLKPKENYTKELIVASNLN